MTTLFFGWWLCMAANGFNTCIPMKSLETCQKAAHMFDYCINNETGERKK